jgi:hypothetical protein
VLDQALLQSVKGSTTLDGWAADSFHCPKQPQSPVIGGHRFVGQLRAANTETGDLQRIRRPSGHDASRFTRERSLVRNQPRPSTIPWKAVV